MKLNLMSVSCQDIICILGKFFAPEEGDTVLTSKSQSFFNTDYLLVLGVRVEGLGEMSWYGVRVRFSCES